ncbi:hypothetical protein CSUB8523_0032 [Campylobacter subantarcticus LMG 24377]|uniref:Uncharacterized protein n=1 Tax=Campylobacter subantarcticus TaxID=497724 RepID=A0ABW9N3X4_9BACT|nr:hypothetical protein [Campylobacter subantarcticus]AJC91611.1 hypothetical protein CSUB8523_0032 [Campylobacter subantarcticus LMG 24377]EAL3939108.1 hypothetical protein [Campylobacter lari]MPB98944.1 hypothetical protein [Campylobacter subantarcticus]
MNTVSLFDELLEELGTQSLARLPINIFNVNSYEAYMESAKLTTNMQKATQQHGNNPNGFGQFYETLEVGKENINNAYNKNKNRSFTTDELAEISKVFKGENIDLYKKETILANYSNEEIKNLTNNVNLDNLTKTNHTIVDTVTLNEKGEIAKTEQLKAVNDSIFGKEYNRYFEAIKNGNLDYIKTDKETYERAQKEIEKLESAIEKAPEEKQASLEKKLQEYKSKFSFLTQGNEREKAGYTKEANSKNHTDKYQALKEVYIIQAKQAAINIFQTGASDAGVVVLSTFASGVIAELKSEFIKKEHEDFDVRFKRLLSRVIESGKDAFIRGANYGIIDVIVGIASQYFKRIGGHLKALWKNLRSSLKSIWNAIYAYITGKIKSFDELIKVILKSLFSAIMTIFAIALEEQICQALGGSPLAQILSIGISIFICSLAVVLFSKTVEITINSFVAIFAKANLAKVRREEVEMVFDKIMPKMIENQESLEIFIDDYMRDLKNTSNMSFQELQTALNNSDYTQANQSIVNLAEKFGVDDLFKTRKEFDDFMFSNENLKI